MTDFTQGNVVFSKELARRYGDQGIVSTSLNPGNLKTDLQRHAKGLQLRMMVSRPRFHRLLMLTIYVQHAISYEAPLGALTQLRAGTSPEAADWNGKYLIPWAREGDCRKEAKDPALGEKLWAWLEEQVKDL